MHTSPMKKRLRDEPKENKRMSVWEAGPAQVCPKNGCLQRVSLIAAILSNPVIVEDCGVISQMQHEIFMGVLFYSSEFSFSF